ncbi:hypothetical protein RR48_14154 [Papilio machaon]|uniref:DUF4777 domain-containing protein n=1 Tax=Papilio machaon TaxID=76193 RepID=A0A194QN62_PAPMA|nr:hypothetical protein RR48_14154 [Papilio machaon]
MTTEEAAEAAAPPNPPGRLILKYLHDVKEGATSAEIVRFLRANYNKLGSDELNQTVEKILENGVALGFLERKGSNYLNWKAREACGGWAKTGEEGTRVSKGGYPLRSRTSCAPRSRNRSDGDGYAYLHRNMRPLVNIVPLCSPNSPLPVGALSAERAPYALQVRKSIHYAELLQEHGAQEVREHSEYPA